MQRRQVLKYTALLTGAVVGAPLAASLLSGCTPEQASTKSKEGLKFVSKSDFEFLTNIIDAMLPATDSPSASDVGVNYTIDYMVGVVYSEKDKVHWNEQFKSLLEHVNSSGKDFISLSAAEKLSVLTPLDSRKNESEAGKGFRSLKQQAIAYYLSTEKISKEFLNFLPVPGEYKPCVTLEEVGGKAWAI